MTDVYEKIVSKPSRDDLTEIKGIGTTTSEKLYNANIVTVKQIAEMTPSKLSETPGIGLATATKFIAAAKTLLSNSQTAEIVINSQQDFPSVKDESSSEIIEKYEVAEIIVEESEEVSEESQKKVSEDHEHSKLNPKWFPDKFNYSRLTASYPPISERAKNIIETVEEADHIVVETKTKQIADDIEFATQPEIKQVNEYEEDTTQDTIPELQIRRDQAELKNSIDREEADYTPVEPKKIDFEYSRDSTFESIIHQQISNVFKDAGCYEIPSTFESLKQYTASLDYLGCKSVKVSEDLKILLLFPVKRFDQEGTVLVDKVKLELKSHSKKNDIGAYIDIEQISQNLLQVRDSIYENITNHQKFLDFFQKYLQITPSLEREFGHKSLFFLSGSTQYKIVIEPILLCYNPPRSMEKSLVFPYQKSTNLHAVTRSDLAPLIKFLEKKYRMIESRTKKSNPVKEYQNANIKFRSRVRAASFPVFVYAAALIVIYLAELYFILRLFNTIGFAVIGIYEFLLLFFYFRAHKTKKKVLVQFETPYYLQNLDYSEIDILDFKYELNDELLAQFGYECLGKHAKFGVMEQVEANTLKNNLDTKKKGSQFHTIYGSEDIKEIMMRDTANNYSTKYNSFLEDS